MSGSDPKPEDVARRMAEKADAGSVEAAHELETLEETAPEAAGAAEQERADGPGQSGLSR